MSSKRKLYNTYRLASEIVLQLGRIVGVGVKIIFFHIKD